VVPNEFCTSKQRLEQKWIDFLTNEPEDDMGSQTVDVTFTDGSVEERCHVFNAEEIQLSNSCVDKTISDIKIHVNKVRVNKVPKLVEIANQLDQKGLYKEADRIDKVAIAAVVEDTSSINNLFYDTGVKNYIKRHAELYPKGITQHVNNIVHRYGYRSFKLIPDEHSEGEYGIIRFSYSGDWLTIVVNPQKFSKWLIKNYDKTIEKLGSFFLNVSVEANLINIDRLVTADRKGWIGVDLDRTLAYYESGYAEKNIIGDPIPEMFQRVLSWIAEGKKVKIFTARVAGGNKEQEKLIREWQDKNGLDLEVTCEKDSYMEELWDDRAVQVEKNTGKPIRASIDPLTQREMLQTGISLTFHTTPEFEKKHKKRSLTKAEKDYQNFHEDMQKDYLVQIANQFDQKGLYKEADKIDEIVKGQSNGLCIL